ncbi:type VII secretion target [Mycobacterium genavense]|uniref:type VII secretion target n=1 Tax=Mycobacterium genavense TaxID=36812 RepID=UPI0009FD3548
MADLAVTPEHLDSLAIKQDQAATQATTAASAGSNVEIATWVTHGVISGVSNVAFTKAAAARKKTADAMSKASTDLPASCAPRRPFTEAPTTKRARASTSSCSIFDRRVRSSPRRPTIPAARL